jgi:hypothetical protein
MNRHPTRLHPSAESKLISTKLVPPVPRAGLIARAGLQSLLEAGLAAKLCLLDAPAGSGKTTLLAQWCATAGAGRVAWVSLDESDNDPTRLWTSIGEALHGAEAGVASAALRALRRTGVRHERVVLPSLLNDLNGIGSPLVLVLDDYHLITDTTCHRLVTFFLDHLPARVHLLLATRVDPPLPLARMRAKGELAELRAAEFQFTDEEAAALLNGAMGLQLATEDVERLAERTEGWAPACTWPGSRSADERTPAPSSPPFTGTTATWPTTWPPTCSPASRRRSGGSCSGPRSCGACPARCATTCWRPRGPPSSCGGWSVPTCSWCPWTTGGSGIATISCSASCCAWSSAVRTPSWSRRCIGGPRPGTAAAGTSRRPSTTSPRPGSSPRPGR